MRYVVPDIYYVMCHILQVHVAVSFDINIMLFVTIHIVMEHKISWF